MSVGDLLARIATRLDAAGIPYMIAGSFASTFHGVPRSTHDIDIIIDPTGASLAALLAALPEADYYVDHDAAKDALRRLSTFNVIDLASGWKLDLIIRKARPFSVEEMARRQRGELNGAAVTIATAEDAIIAKLGRAKLSDSDRQLRVHREVGRRTRTRNAMGSGPRGAAMTTKQSRLVDLGQALQVNAAGGGMALRPPRRSGRPRPVRRAVPPESS